MRPHLGDSAGRASFPNSAEIRFHFAPAAPFSGRVSSQTGMGPLEKSAFAAPENDHICLFPGNLLSWWWVVGVYRSLA